MSRQARIILPGFPHHVIHRGHSDGTIFSGDRDYLAYLSNLRELKERFNVRVLAYCLLLNHVHLLLEPVYDAADLIRLMKNLAGRATQYWNRLHNSSGSLWQGRYRSSLVKRDYFLLACCRYIELNPVRWQMVSHPADYRWSSYRQRVLLDTPRWIDVDDSYLALGHNEGQRRDRYRQFIGDGVAEEEIRLIRDAVQRGRPTGDARFIDEIEALAGGSIENDGRGGQRLQSDR